MLMKRISFMIVLSIICAFTLFAQTIVITGTVSSAEGKGPIQGATVQVKGTGIGTLTNAQGNYTLNVPPDATAIIFSFVGMKRQEVEIAGRSVIDVEMESDVLSLGEVVVTGAYGIKSTLRSTSSLTQVISGDKLNDVRQININNALAGKVSGIQFRGQSAVSLDRTGSLRLRGDGGFGTGEGMLYVIDGTILPNPGDLNLDDIEDVTVLSGPGASALLGPQGANGAIILTTRKAKAVENETVGIEVNSGIMTSSVYILPAYQNEYAGGADNEMKEYKWEEGDPLEWLPLDGKLYPDYMDDSSWGPRMEEQEYIPWYSWYPGTKYTGTTALLVPQPDNVRDFYERGWTYNNNISFSKVGDDYNIRATIGNIAIKGNIPKSSQNRITSSFRTSYDLTDKLTFAANINFITTLTKGEFNDGLNNQSTGSFNEFFHRDLDMGILQELRGLRTPGGIYASWNHKGPDYYRSDNPKDFYAAFWWYNYYTFFDLINLPSRSDYLFGDISLEYKIIKGLSAKVTYRRYQDNAWKEEQYPTDLYDSQTDAAVPWGNWKAQGYYYTYTSYLNRENIESLFSFKKELGDFKINANAGSDFFRAVFKSNSANTVNGLIVRNLYSIANSVDQPNIINNRTKEKYRAILIRGNVGFRDFVYGEFSLRNDWFSTLAPSNNSIFSKSLGGAFIFSNFLGLPFLDYGKIRASWGEIPTAIGVFAYPGSQFSLGLYKWNDNILMSTSNQLVDKTIHGAVKDQMEIGLDLRLLKNKIGFAATFWEGTEKGIPMNLKIASYSGFDSRYLNSGKIVKQGLDFILNLRPLSNNNLTYELNATFSFLINNKVVKIADSLTTSVEVENVGEWWSGAPAMYHEEGKQWGVLIGQGMKMWDGKPLLDQNNRYVVDESKNFGSVLPKITGGIQNSFRIMKNFTIIVNLDYQVGGKYFSLSDMLGTQSGVTARTVGTNNLGIPIRDPVEYGGGILVTGVDPNTHEDRMARIEAHEYFYENLVAAGIYDPFVYDLTYIKFRELSISYEIPVGKLKVVGNYFQSMNISFSVLNPWLVYSDTRDFDPSEISYAGGEYAQFPGTRSFGMNLKVIF